MYTPPPRCKIRHLYTVCICNSVSYREGWVSQVIQLAPDNDAAHKNLGEIHLHMEPQVSVSVSHDNKLFNLDTPACEVHPVYIWRILQGGVCVSARVEPQDLQLAKKHFQSALRRGSTPDATIHYNLGASGVVSSDAVSLSSR